jgi:iron complex outermembrane receptor protein
MKRLLLPLLLCAVLPLSLQAQNLNVSGIVRDGNGAPLVGVSVVIKGSTVGVTTDVNGGYTISAPADATLVFSFLGMTTREEAIAGRGSIDVTLGTSNQSLDEVVVTALGIRRETRALGYAISSVKGDALVQSGVTANPLSALHGKAAGVGIQSTAAGPTGGVQIKIRGASSLEATSTTRPLFVVDGVPIFDQESGMASRGYDPLNSFDYGSGVNDINPEDIASMEILKGAKASVLYGSAGANGVVLITTKNGGVTRGLGVQVSYGHEWEKPYSLIDFQNEYGSGENEFHTNMDTQGKRHLVSSRFNFGPKFDGKPIIGFDGKETTYSPYNDNYMALFRNGSSNNTQVSITGGNEKSNARLSYTNYSYNGTMVNQEHTKNSLSFSGNTTVSDFAKFEVTQNLYLTETQNRRQNLQQLVAMGTFNRDYDIEKAMSLYKDENGYMPTKESLIDMGWPAAFTGTNGGEFFDMLWNQYENRNIDEKTHSITSVKVDLKFLPFLSLKLQGGLDYTVTDYIKQNKVLRKNEVSGEWEGGKFQHATEQNNIQQYEAYLFFDKDFMEENLNVFAFAGPSYRKTSYTKVGVGTMGNFNFPDFWSVSNTDGWPSSFDDRVANFTREGEAIYSMLGQMTVSWKNKYFLELQARNDWASTLPKQNRSYFYPGVSFTWNFTEDFKIPTVNYGKLRASWADVGRPATRYYALRSYTVESIPTYPGVNDITGPSDLFSGDLRPERKREVEIGFDLRFFKQDRAQIDFSYYNNNIYDQIMSVPLSAATGAKNIRINAGEVNNQGIELLLRGKPVLTSAFEWDLALTATRQWSKVVSLYPGITEVNREVSGVTNRAAEGLAMGELWTYDYVRDKDPNSPTYGERIVTNGYYSISNQAEDMICVGNINPDLFGGLNSSFSVKGEWGTAALNLGIDYKIGGSILSYSNFYLKGNGLTTETLQYRDEAHGGLKWTDDQGRVRYDGVKLAGIDAATGQPNEKIISAYDYYSTFLHDMSSGWQPDEIKENSYVKFRELALGYSLPAKWINPMKLQSLTLSFTARNLFYIYRSIDNIDPESILGTDSWVENSNYPASRIYGFKVNLSF